MPIEIHSDLSLAFEGHELSLRNEGASLVAEFSSLSAVRRLRRTLPLEPGPLPEVMRFPGLDELTTRVVVRGRTIAVLATSNHVASIRMRWWGLFATMMRLPRR